MKCSKWNGFINTVSEKECVFTLMELNFSCIELIDRAIPMSGWGKKNEII
jgi:hypothetical protein